MKPYADSRPKGEQVRAMFDGIAPVYDLLNDVLSLGLARRWRNRLVATVESGQCHAEPDASRAWHLSGAPKAFSQAAGGGSSAHCHAEPDASRAWHLSGAPKAIVNCQLSTVNLRILDLATGTGDLAAAFSRRGFSVTAADPSEGMLALARRKAGSAVDFVVASAEKLPFADGEFDAVTVSFGVRNFSDIPVALTEMRRVLRPGGTVAILEFSTPRGLWGALYKFYFHRVLPFVGGLFSRDGRAYAYLPTSVAEFPAPARFTEMLAAAGFTDLSTQSLTGGVAYIYKGVVSVFR